MQVICASAARFYNAANKAKEINKAGDEVEVIDRSLHNSFTLTASKSEIQNAPDWIANDPMFKAMEAAGAITVVQVLSKPAPQAPAPAASGWGAKPDGVGLGFNKPTAVPVTSAV